MNNTSMNTDMDPDTLAAFVDGELSPEQAARVVIHLADHPQDQAYVDELMAANVALAQAFAAPLSEPVPAAIHAAIMGASANVVPLRPRGWRPDVRMVTYAALAVAAALAMVAVLPPLATNPGDGLAIGPVAAGSALDSALTTLASGTPLALEGGAEVMILATLPTPTGHCREVEVLHHEANRLDLGIACRSDGTPWIVEAMLSETLASSGTDGFVPASGAEAQSLQFALDRLGAGETLLPAAEADLLAKGW